MFDFKKQYAVGQQGAAVFEAHWPSRVLHHEDRRGPDYVDARGRIIELKCDTYSMTDTPHAFLERWGNLQRGTPGGPWAASEKGCTTFVYLYLPDRVWLVFEDLGALVKRLDLVTRQMKPVRIANKSWVTVGFKVPRSELTDLYREEQLPPAELKEGA